MISEANGHFPKQSNFDGSNSSGPSEGVQPIDGRDANHSNFCGIIPFFEADFRITISNVKIPQNKEFTNKNGTR